MQRGLCTCSCCGERSTKKEWLKTQQSKKGTSEPVDDKCKECWDQYSTVGVCSYMDWTQYCEFINDGGQEEIDSIEKDMNAHQSDVKHKQADVLDEVTLKLDVERHYEIMNASEFGVNIGKPNTKMPAVPSLEVINERTGDKEEVYMFEHPLLKHRTLTMTASHAVQKAIYSLSHGDVTHQAHADKTFAKLRGDTFDKNLKVAENLAAGRIVAPPLSTYRSRYDTWKKGVDEKKAQLKSNGDDDEDSGEESSDSDDDGRDHGISAADDATVAATAAADAAGGVGSPSAPEAAAIGPQSQAVAAGSVCGSQPPGGPSRPPRRSTSRSRTPRGSQAADCEDEVASGRKLKPSDGADYYIQVLDLHETMNGAKLGVQLHHAELLKEKYDDSDDDFKRLNTHIEKYREALSLSPSMYTSLSDSKIKACIDSICVKEGFPIPPHIQRHLIVKVAGGANGHESLRIRFAVDY